MSDLRSAKAKTVRRRDGHHGLKIRLTRARIISNLVDDTVAFTETGFLAVPRIGGYRVAPNNPQSWFASVRLCARADGVRRASAEELRGPPGSFIFSSTCLKSRMKRQIPAPRTDQFEAPKKSPNHNQEIAMPDIPTPHPMLNLLHRLFRKLCQSSNASSGIPKALNRSYQKWICCLTVKPVKRTTRQGRTQGGTEEGSG